MMIFNDFKAFLGYTVEKHFKCNLAYPLFYVAAFAGA